MQLSNEEFRRLGHAAVEMAADYLTELPAGPVLLTMCPVCTYCGRYDGH
jgi:hypothetical protein